MITTGIKGLDALVNGLRLGDNVVWQIDDIKDYADLVKPFAQQALKDDKNLVYIRFASHKELIKPSKKVKRYNLDAYAGFESFATRVNKIISEEGEGAYYVFDCLSELLSAWASDLMIGNFFMITCPYLYELKTVTYFSILRNNHSFKSIARIRETTQLLLDVYHFEGHFYVHPLKVWNRYTPTMFLPHVKETDDEFAPITDSVNTVKLLSYIHEKGLESTKRNLDYWDRLFLQAEEMLDAKASEKKIDEMANKICNIMVTKNKKMLDLFTKYFSLSDLVELKSRLIGTGFVGGKTVGMLLARKILERDKNLNWNNLSEPHDSFYIGSDIFYSYIVENNWWKLRVQQKTDEGYFEAAEVLKDKMLYGKFPDEIMEYFQQIIEYFGNSPIIIRSSSLLEDSFGNAFAGKYESVFCANQGTPEQRYIQFAEAVREIYSSTMSEDALTYRKQRGLDKLDEQMALLVQRVSGSYHDNYFFPDLAGVGVSYNTYVWNEHMKPDAGMLRLVFGLGTRAVNRVEGDYPRMAALDEPLRRPYSEKDDVRKFSQHDVDVINIMENDFKTIALTQLLENNPNLDLSMIGERDHMAMRIVKEKGFQKKDYWLLTFDKLLKDSVFVDAFKKILHALEESYSYPVEIEFTANFTEEKDFKINLLQCRPLQTKGLGRRVELPKDLSKDEILFESKGYFLGGNISQTLNRIIYVNPKAYNDLSMSDKYEIARIVGRLNKNIIDKEKMQVLLMGPGRWGTTTPTLGIPTKFSEINNISVLVEMAFAESNIMPELSFGTHFFQDLVETEIFYVALFPEKGETLLNKVWFDSFRDIFSEIMPEAAKYKDVICVYDLADKKLKIMSDVLLQKAVCFIK